MINKYNILVVDDDPNVLSAFRTLLDDIQECHYQLTCTFEQVKELVEKEEFNHAFIDIVLPEIDGYEICKYLKQQPNTAKAYFTLMSVDKNQLIHRLDAYSAGAQDFLSKPFDLFELRLILKRKIEFYFQNNEAKPEIAFSVDKETNKIILGNKELDLTNLEYNLLIYFMTIPEKEVEMKHIIENVWGNVSQSNDNVRGLIHRLRNKIELNPKNPIYLISAKNGYIFYPSGLVENS